MNLRRPSRETLLLALILAAGAALRLYGLNWDGGHWLHPDERQIYFITWDLSWPHSLAEALSPGSPLNPRFFAYGSFPFYLLKLVTVLLAPLWPALRDSDNLHLAGRPLAALFDLGTIYLTYRLARTLWPPAGKRGGLRGGALLAAALVSLAVLHVQLAHFYTVDPLLTFFVMLTLNLAAGVAQGDGRRRQAALGIALGLALATKTTAALLIPVVYVAFHARATIPNPQSPISNTEYPTSSTNLFSALRHMIPTLAIAVAVSILAQPYALIDWRTFLADTLRESQIAWGQIDAPYTRQYAGTLPYLYTIWQAALWGAGLPLGLVAWAGLAAALVRWLRRGPWTDTLLLAWAGPYLALTGILYTRYPRYMLPLMPILCLLAVQLLASLTRRRAPAIEGSPAAGGLHPLRPPSWAIGPWSLVILTLLYCLAFSTIYTAPHSWISASEWIYANVPAGSTLAVEEWDTPLPLALDVDGQPRRIEEYDVRTLPLYQEPDGAAKWEALAADLAGSDYLVLASRRLYGSIPRLPDRYPVATRYYDHLFAGDLGFELLGEFTRGPAWLNPRLPPLPGSAPALLRPDESFVVYDHPRALVFRNAGRLPAAELLRRLQ
jgi:4-amino-4-deoxy-L-arabinose transferase-like glycosyltransferase